MRATDRAGLRHFQEYCKDIDEHYVVVGGFATMMLLESAELGEYARATFDIDLVLLTTSSPQVAAKIKSYIKDGGYKIQKGKKDRYIYYRFTEPQAEDFAREIELFATNENNLELDDEQRIIPIDPEVGEYSLSAIMLDQEYFEMIKANIDKKQTAPCTNKQATILLKMSAFNDLRERNDKKWRKHRSDIIKLSLLLTGDERVSLVGRMIRDFEVFIEHLEYEVDKRSFKAITNKIEIEKEQVVDMLKRVFHT